MLATWSCLRYSLLIIRKRFKKLYYFQSFILCDIRIVTIHPLPQVCTNTVWIIIKNLQRGENESFNRDTLTIILWRKKKNASWIGGIWEDGTQQNWATVMRTQHLRPNSWIESYMLTGDSTLSKIYFALWG